MARGKLKLSGGALTCPPGFFCLDTGTILLGVLLFAAFVAIMVFVVKQSSKDAAPPPPPVRPTVVVVESKRQAVAPMFVPTRQADPRFSPPMPERSYTAPPDLHEFAGGPAGGIPINIPTRGVPETVQQMGVLTAPGGTETSGSPTRTILPLFGRKLLTNRDRWNYYTRTDGINPVQVPVQYKRRNCEDDLGCEEIMDGDSVGVPILGQSFVANVYRYNTPRYIPTI